MRNAGRKNDTVGSSTEDSLWTVFSKERAAHGKSEAGENVLLIGDSGTGKMHLATALALAACAQGRRVRFWTVSALVTQMLEAREARQLERLLRNLERPHLVVLEELGYVPFSKAGAELLFDVVSRAYERASLIVTTNLPFESWTEVLGSERLTGAMLDRLTHRVNIIEAKGESYRLKESRRRLKDRLHAAASVAERNDAKPES